jgi:hypothetical protein
VRTRDRAAERRHARRAWICAAILVVGAARVAVAEPVRIVTVRPTGEGALGQPVVGLAVGERTTASRSDDVAGLLGDAAGGIAILDTGASAHVLSAATAARAGVEAEPGARYVEVGVAGDHVLGVSRPCTLALSTAVIPDLAALLGAADADEPRARAAASTPRAHEADALTLSAARLLLHAPPADAAAPELGALLNVVGMPALLHMVAAITPGRGAGPVPVEVLAKDAREAADLWVPLVLEDFNRPHDARNRGPLPALASNPLVAVRAVAGDARVEGRWLLDTGAAVTMLSRATAHALGLADDGGHPRRKVEFSLPLAGISGAERSLPGFRIDRLEVAGEQDTFLIFPRPAVVIQDISVTDDTGRTRTLDGVLGMNLLLASGSDLRDGAFATEHESAFTRIVLDMPRARLGLTPRR